MTGLVDLHRHLDGSLRPGTVAALATRLGVEPPSDLAFFPGMGLPAALGRFAFTLSLLQSASAVRRVASEIVEDAEAEGVTTLEIRFAPQLHGGRIEEITDAALDGIAGRAGLILCGLYGEEPALLSRLVDLARTRRGVVGLDLAGGPSPAHSWGMADYGRALREAEALGLGRTVHAGEGRPPAEIRVAIETLHANRIGHGTTLLDDPAVLELVLERGVTIEACLTSNWHVGALPHWSAHPLPRWLDAGVKVCVCTDNTLLSGVDAREELCRASTLLRPEQVQAVLDFGHAAAFSR